ncbi:MAG TPA: toast rack family protein [Rubrobacteraceae bacterium]|nr:toast rack family protein [Rubrobacteraceae bacterium]
MLAAVIVLAFVAGCARAGELVTERRSVETEGAESVSADLSMSTGNMVVGGGAENLMDATFTYNVPEWEPEVDYGGFGAEKELSVEQPDVTGPVLGGVRNDWEILLNDEVPLDLSAFNSSGDEEFDLGSLSLASFSVEASSGDIEADLGGEKPLLEEVEVDSSSGDVGMEMRGEYSSPVGLSVDLSSGDLELDLGGRWEEDLDGEVNLSSGTATVTLPREAGVYVEAETSSGDVNADGFRLEDGAYVNDAYEESEVTLTLSVESSSGDVNLQLAG